MRRRALLVGGNSKPFQKHLIGYYPFDTDFEDKIEPKVDLIATGTGIISLNPAVIGNGAYSPAGTNTALRNTVSPDRHKYSFTDGINDVPYSISMHLKIKSKGAQSSTVIGKNIENGGNANPNWEYLLQISGDNTQLLWVKCSEGLITNAFRYRVTMPVLDTWFHLVITDDALGGVKFYIDGVEQLSIKQIDGTGFVKFATTTEAYFGAFNALGVPSTGRFLEGGLDDFGVFKNYVLTQEDIDWIWNGGNPRRLKNV